MVEASKCVTYSGNGDMAFYHSNGVDHYESGQWADSAESAVLILRRKGHPDPEGAVRSAWRPLIVP